MHSKEHARPSSDNSSHTKAGTLMSGDSCTLQLLAVNSNPQLALSVQQSTVQRSSARPDAGPTQKHACHRISLSCHTSQDLLVRRRLAVAASRLGGLDAPDGCTHTPVKHVSDGLVCAQGRACSCYMSYDVLQGIGMCHLSPAS